MRAAGNGPRLLAVDLDGTLIPLSGSEQNRKDLCILNSEIRRNRIVLIYVTGRHFTSFQDAVREYELPAPDWVICDVGTSIFKSVDGKFHFVDVYRDHLAAIVAEQPASSIRKRLDRVRVIQLQEEVKQGQFKVSYYADASQLDTLTAEIQQELDRAKAPYSIIQSVDPFNGNGLIDLLPAGCSKAYALQWLIQHLDRSPEDVTYAGDSGNDFEPLTAGYSAIVVANADRQLARRVYDEHQHRRLKNRLFLASKTATSGVLQGCYWYGLIDGNTEIPTRLGALPVSHDRTHFRVWAPRCSSIEVEIRDDQQTTRQVLAHETNGYFSGIATAAKPNAKYGFVVNGKEVLPDQTTRFQPDGVHGYSQIIDHRLFAWTDQTWNGVSKRNLVIYEMHVGAFTVKGSFRAAIERIPELVELGITAVELMPVAQSPGRWNWGYDGVNLFAVCNTYGQPDDLKAFVDACHAQGIAVILDVVYNHVGPEGNYLAKFAPYSSQKHRTPWGDAFNFDEEQAEHVRRYVVENVIYWIDEFHLDGLRLDAVHFMFDDSAVTILHEIRSVVSKYNKSAQRSVHLFAETNVFDDELLDQRNCEPIDAIWCDCLMHSIYSHASTDLQFSDREYLGASDIAHALQSGYVYAIKGKQRTAMRDKNPVDYADMSRLVVALQNHDALGNHPQGRRLHQLASKEFQTASAALILLHPGIPLIFMGEEIATDTPFPFFADFENEALRRSVDRCRKQEMQRHMHRGYVSPFDSNCFQRAKLSHYHTASNQVFAWYRDLIKLRKKGLVEGWLAPEHVEFVHDLERHIFCLTFDDSKLAITIHVRLTPNHDAQPCPVYLDLEEHELLLSSQPICQTDPFELSLMANHAVIMRRHQ